MQNVLITGGAGFIGSNFVHYLYNSSPGINFINIDALTYAGNIKNLEGFENIKNYHFVHGNICDRELLKSLFTNYNIDTVVHFAAESHVDRSIKGPLPFIETNIVGTAILLEAAREAWKVDNTAIKHEYRFHHISTDEVFGSLNSGDPPFAETTPFSPNSPYAASKAASDHLVLSYFHTYGLPVTISNCSNNYGPYQFPEKLIPLIILNALSNKPLPLYGDGMQIRDWLYVEDHCEAIFQILKKGMVGETYNLGGNNQPTNLEIVNTICHLLDELVPRKDHLSYEKQIRYVKDRPGHDRRYAMNITKIKNMLGWQPKEQLESGLQRTIQWYLQNSEWLESIQKKKDYNSWIDNHYNSQKGSEK
jgi:dTDP-glucose 4,6-dehydratase